MKNKCPCCGCYTLEEDYGSYEICPVCFWEEDPAAEKNPNIVFGGNSVSLHQAQENYRKIGACDADQLQHVRKPLPELGEWNRSASDMLCKHLRTSNRAGEYQSFLLFFLCRRVGTCKAFS